MDRFIPAGPRAFVKRLAFGMPGAGQAMSRVMESGWRTRRLLILCYHGVSTSDEHLWNDDLYLPPDAFRRRLSVLRRWNCNVLSLADALPRLFTGQLPPRAVCLTFDDGGVDFYASAFPILREFGYPATVYLTTFYCGRREPVFTGGCHYIAWRGRGATVDLGKLTGGPEQRLDLGSAEAQVKAAQVLRRHADEGALSADRRRDLLAAFAAAVGVDFDELVERRLLQIMDPAEVGEVARAGIDIQLHTHRHRTPGDKDLFLKELKDNREAIRELTGTSGSHFCYPSGVCRPEFLPWLEEAGVVSATTTQPGLATRATHPLLLPRFVDTGSVSEVQFEAWLCGAAAVFPAARRLMSRQQ